MHSTLPDFIFMFAVVRRLKNANLHAPKRKGKFIMKSFSIEIKMSRGKYGYDQPLSMRPIPEENVNGK